MRFLAAATVCVVALGGDASRATAQDRVLQFGGIEYRLAFVDVAKGGEITNEYVPPGETLKNWTTLLAVRSWPKRSDALQTANAWIDFVRRHTFKQAETFQQTKSGPVTDVIVEVWLLAPDTSYLEPNLHRFVIEADTEGVKAYQFAERLPMNPKYGGDITKFWNQRRARFDELAELRAPIFEGVGDNGGDTRARSRREEQAKNKKE